MICTLTHYQARVVMTRVPELHAEAMREHRSVHGPKAHAYDLPAIAWRQIRDYLWLNPAYYGPLGGKLDSQPKALYRAIQLIHQAVLEMEHHPALERRSTFGAQMQVIPAFEDTPAVGHSALRWYYPYPGYSKFILLTPRWEMLHGTETTRWVPSTTYLPKWSWTFEPGAHLMFKDVKVASHAGVPSLVRSKSPG